MADLTRADWVLRKYPNEVLQPWKFQKEIIEELGEEDRVGLYMEQGTGKTLTSIILAISALMENRFDRILVILPPILSDNWLKNILMFQGMSGMIYRGTPKQRKAMELFSTPVTIMSYDIFRIDHKRIVEAGKNLRVYVIADEATALKNVSSQISRLHSTFTAGQGGSLLTGTPTVNPGDAYPYIRFTDPQAYRNLNHFRNLHVGKVDHFGQVLTWKNLDIIARRMEYNASRVLMDDVMPHIPPAVYEMVPYKLDDAHKELYDRVAVEQLVLLGDELEGGKIDLTSSAQKLQHALQQLIINWGHFAGNDDLVSNGENLVTQILDEIEGRKLIVATNYRLTNQRLMQRFEKYNPRVLMGGLTDRERKEAQDTFNQDPTCRLLFIQPRSGGFGVDGLQNVCNDILLLETPVTSIDWKQVVSRLRRGGQTRPTNVRVAVAQGTLQVRRHNSLLSKDSVNNQVVRNLADLREMIFGN